MAAMQRSSKNHKIDIKIPNNDNESSIIYQRIQMFFKASDLMASQQTRGWQTSNKRPHNVMNANFMPNGLQQIQCYQIHLKVM